VTGFFVAPSGRLSPQIDILVVDSRYPLLAQYEDGTVVATLHSVLAAVEVKVRVSKRDIVNTIRNAETITGVASEIYAPESWSRVRTAGVAYRTRLKRDALASHFFALTSHRYTDFTVLRVLPADNEASPRALGLELHWEPVASRKRVRTNWFETVRPTLAPLSDLYYELVQDSYYTLAARNFDFHDLGVQMLSYMAWGTFAADASPGVCCAERFLRSRPKIRSRTS
jgi:hypothetical protein